MYRLNISGLCSAQNYTYATSGFLDKTRLEEWISANSAFIPQRSLEDTGGQKTYDLVSVSYTHLTLPTRASTPTA